MTDSPSPYTFPTISGIRVDLANPTAEMIDLYDIATGLGNTIRYGGHSLTRIDVASHCVNVANVVKELGGGDALVLAGLFHDAHEAYIGDLISPLKKYVLSWEGGLKWHTLECQFDAAIAERFGFDPYSLSDPLVKRADEIVYAWERRDLVGVPAWDTTAEGIPSHRCPLAHGTGWYKMAKRLLDARGVV